MDKRFKLPESRLPSLYGDFRNLKDLNPDGYEANVKTWKRYFKENYFAEPTSTVTFQVGDSLLEELSLDTLGSPKSIDVVIDQLVEDTYLIPLEVFNSGSYPSFDDKVSQSVLPGLFSWINFGQLFRRRFVSRKNELTTGYLKQTTFVIRQVIKDKGKSIRDKIESNLMPEIVGLTDTVFDTLEFCEITGMNEQLSSSQDRELVLTFLEKYDKVIKRDNNLVKLILPSVSQRLQNFSADITEADHGILEIKRTTSNIQKQVLKLEKEIDNINTTQRTENFRRLPRKTQIEIQRAKVISEDYLTRLLGYLNNLKGIRHQLDAGLTTQMVFKTLSSSRDILASINSYIGSSEKVDELMENIQRETELSEEIGAALASSIGIDKEIIDLEIEEELKKLEEEEKEEGIPEKPVPASVIKKPLAENSSDELLHKLKELSITDEKAQKEGTAEKPEDQDSDEKRVPEQV